MSDDKTRFRPVQGDEEKILNFNYHEGFLYFATDTGRIYLDANDKNKIPLGSSGVKLLYGTATIITDSDATTGEISYSMNWDADSVEDYENCNVDDLILNNDGCFYRITAIDKEEEIIYCDRLSVSGSGGGGGNSNIGRAGTVSLDYGGISNYVNGQPVKVKVTAKSATDSNGEDLDYYMTLHFALYAKNSGKDGFEATPYEEWSQDTFSKVEEEIDLLSHLRESTNSKFIVYASGQETGDTKPKEWSMTTHDMTLTANFDFSALNVYSEDNIGEIAIPFIIGGGSIEKVLTFYVDDEVYETYPKTGAQTAYFTNTGAFDELFKIPISSLAHGRHKIKIELAAYNVRDKKKGVVIDPLTYEIAVARTGETNPIIWFGNYNEVYYSYDKIQIPYMIYSPEQDTCEINITKGSELLQTLNINFNEYSTKGSWAQYEITDAPINEISTYYFSSGRTTEVVSVKVEEDTLRNMNLVKQSSLLLNFSAAGRSNDESSVTREKWTYEDVNDFNKIKSAEFTGFNWYNNGWILDENDNTCLRISNGAEFKIPVKELTLNSSATGKQNCTFEIEFKVRNIQDYSNLVQEFTRYKLGDESPDDEYWADFSAGLNNYNYQYSKVSTNTHYSNYDSYLAAALGSVGYDALEYVRTQKIINTSASICSFYDGTTGLCLGPQDGFFSVGSNTVNVDYVEDSLINLTVSFQKGKLTSMYINGILTSVAQNTSTDTIIINTDGIVFNSNFCDIDLYKCRIYRDALDLRDVDINYAVDRRNVLLYDETEMLCGNKSSSTDEYGLNYEKLLVFNDSSDTNCRQPNYYTMPYMVVTTSYAKGNKLPYSKLTTIPVSVKFVNVPLERAYKSGELASLAQRAGVTVDEYYLHHCPSWSGKDIDLVVQGTSSEFYPRRNYKMKTQLKTIDLHKYCKASGVTEENYLNYYTLNKETGTTVPAVAPYNAETTYYEVSTTNNLSYDETKSYQMVIDGGPYASSPKSKNKLFYMDNDYVGTNKFTLKVDYMESSGSYNMGLANLVDNAYNKHPLEDYKDIATYTYNKTTKEYSPVASIGQTYYDSLRTNTKGFPMLMFHQTTNADGSVNTPQYIGRYNMLLDKGSDECYGFKPYNDKLEDLYVLNRTTNKYQKFSNVAECWEFSDNARTYCSFRDPKNRKEFSFRQGVAEDYKDEPRTSTNTAPVVCDSFEYRYHKDGDLFDFYYNPTVELKKNSKLADILSIDYPDNIIEIPQQDSATNKLDYTDAGWKDVCESVFSKMSNWEKACSWVWSTCIDNAPEDGVYNAVTLKEALYSPNVYYVISDTVTNEETGAITYVYQKSTEAFDEEKTYYKLTNDKYTAIALTDDENELYQKNKYYYLQGSVYMLADGDYDSSYTYFILTKASLSDEYKLTSPVTYNGVTYEYDTKNYRLAKFKNEFTQHFDKEYALVYFVVTEILLCYDSRGKNCMMASWGPQVEGGEYIWYPIFYDMDTQLGINNTGIPSFEYYVNAHADGCFSTNDSVLWANMYNCFFGEIKSKYYELRDLGNMLQSVDYIEKWYLNDPDVTGMIASRGERPIIALNLDEYYKYISITNGKVGYQDKKGDIITDEQGTYFYALQGDRSLSRQQFLQRRLNFADGWLNYGAYSRSSGVAIYGRVSANDPANTSDAWVTGTNTNSIGQAIPGLTGNSEYYTGEKDDNGYDIKTNYLDADTYVELTPYQRGYVTIGGDNEALPSVECQQNSYRYTVPMAESIKSSPQYAEQLLYIYGANYLQSVGDISLLYWREFYAPNAPKLKNLYLGSDYPGFKNHKLKFPTLAAKSGGTEKPLLEDVNFTGVKIDQATDVVFDFTSSEKLKTFKAVGSNLASVLFADGVALSTLYLPDTIKVLKLTEARKLNHLITDISEEPIAATLETWDNGNWTAPEGLYIDGLFNNNSTNITTLDIRGGALGYDSYTLLEKLYDIKKSSGILSLNMEDVDWCPYKLVEDGEVRENGVQYYVSDDHYTLNAVDASSYFTDSSWELAIKNQTVFKKKDTFETDKNKITGMACYEMLKEMANSSRFTSTSAAQIPNISGIIYINNASEKKETDISNELSSKYPNVRFFFENVKSSYSAKFVKVDNSGVMTQIGLSQKLADDVDINTAWFTSPYDLYDADELPELKKVNYDFHGWALDSNDPSDIIIDIYADTSRGQVAPTADQVATAWNSLHLQEGKHDYTFYAIFKKHEYEVTFYDADGITVIEKQYKTTDLESADGKLTFPSTVPWKDDSALGTYETYQFLGYAKTLDATKPITLSTFRVTDNTSLYAIFNPEPISVYNNIHPEYFEIMPDKEYKDSTFGGTWADSQYTIPSAEGAEIALICDVKGKLTIPTSINGKKVWFMGASFNASSGHVNELTHVFFAGDSNGNKYLRQFGEECFHNAPKLKFVEFPEGLRVISARAFRNLKNLDISSITCSTLALIGESAFNLSRIGQTGNEIFYVDGNVTNLQYYAFGNCDISSPMQTMQIGTEDNYSNLKFSFTVQQQQRIINNYDKNVIIYSKNYQNTEENKTFLSVAFGANVTIM